MSGLFNLVPNDFANNALALHWPEIPAVMAVGGVVASHCVHIMLDFAHALNLEFTAYLIERNVARFEF